MKKKLSHDAQGNPLKVLEYHKNVEEGLNDMKYNRVISKEDLLKEIENWDKE
ncbi:MAG: hypothetical protein ABI892_12650 [Flavobacterium sp.]